MLTEPQVLDWLLKAETDFIAHISQAKEFPTARAAFGQDIQVIQTIIVVIYRVLELPKPNWQRVVETESFAAERTIPV